MKRSVTLQGQEMKAHRHICLIYNSEEELYGTVLPYLKEGFDQGEQLFTVVDDAEYDACLSKLSESGVPVAHAIRDNQLKALRCSEAYGGAAFEPAQMLSRVADTLAATNGQSFPFVRTCGDMNWAADPAIDRDEVMLYEAKVNLMVPKYECTCVCVYDARRFPGSVILDVLSTHPVVITQGHAIENPYYMRPEDYLPLLNERRKKRNAHG